MVVLKATINSNKLSAANQYWFLTPQTDHLFLCNLLTFASRRFSPLTDYSPNLVYSSLFLRWERVGGRRGTLSRVEAWDPNRETVPAAGEKGGEGRSGWGGEGGGWGGDGCRGESRCPWWDRISAILVSQSWGRRPAMCDCPIQKQTCWQPWWGGGFSKQYGG